MPTHRYIDERSRALARAVSERIDRDPDHRGLEQARSVCCRWLEKQDHPGVREWLEILRRPWEEVRAVLLDESEYGVRMRQNTPFCGILTPRERWDIYRQFKEQYETSRT